MKACIILTVAALVVGGSAQKQCGDMCTAQFDPVCAVYGNERSMKTFSNKCQAEIFTCKNGFNLHEAPKGACESSSNDNNPSQMNPTERRCSDMCTFQYEPVCAVYGNERTKKTFSNKCEAENYTCKNGFALHEAPKGACEGTSTSSNPTTQNSPYQRNPLQNNPFPYNPYQKMPSQNSQFPYNPYQNNPFQTRPYQSNPFQNTPYQFNSNEYIQNYIKQLLSQNSRV